MGKLRVGDWVKVLEADGDLDISKNELGRVKAVAEGQDEKGHYGLEVVFASDMEKFDYVLYLANHEVKRVGTKLKKVRAAKLVVGDQIVLDGENDDNLIHAEVYKIKEIEHDYVRDIVTLRGKGFAVELSPVELTLKVPVIV